MQSYNSKYFPFIRVGKEEGKCRKIYANKDFENISQIIVYSINTMNIE